MISLPVISVERDRTTVEALDRALAAHGCSLHPVTTDVTPGPESPWLAVVVVSEDAERDPAFVACVERLHADPRVELVPVAPTEELGEVLSHLSSLRLPLVGVERAAERIGIVARTGSADLAAWIRTTERARAWIRAGRPRGAALSRSEADVAGALLLRPIGSAAVDERDAVAGYVAHSRARHRSQRVAVAAVVAAVVVVLSVTSVAALGQARTAQREADRADAASASARADRLLRAAEEQLDFDPDLPWLLTAAALEADPSPEVEARAATIVGQLWPHRTFDLPARPIRLAPSRSDRVAVLAFGGRRIDIVDGSSGDELGRYDAPGDATIGAWTVSPDGRRLAVEADDELLLVDVGSDRDPEVLRRGSINDLEWPTDDRLLVATDSTVEGIDTSDGRPTTLAEVPAIEHIAFAPEAGWIVAAHGDAVTLLDADGTVRGTYRGEIAGIEDVQVAFSEDEVTVQLPEALVRVPLTAFDGIGEDEPAVERVTVYGSAVRTISTAPGSPSPACLVDGSLGAVSPGAQILIDAVPAHRGTCLGVTVLGDGSWVSIGSDDKLRHWVAPTPEGYIDEGAGPPELIGLRGSYGTGESRRAMIAAGAGEEQATATAPWAYTVALVDRRTGAVDDLVGIGGIDSPVRPSDRAGVGVRFYPSSTARWDVNTRTGPELPLPPVIDEQSLSAISPDGRYVAVAGQAASYVLDADAGDGTSATWAEQRYAQVARPIGVDVDDDGQVTVLADDGTLVRPGDDPVPLVELRQPLVTGHIARDGTVVLVAADGQVLVGDDREVARRGRVDVDLAPIAVRIASDGSMAAIIGFRETQIMDLASGLVIQAIAAPDSYRAVSDVAFDDDPAQGGLLVRNDGGIARIDLVEPSAIARHIGRHAPRPATATEVEVHGMEEP